MFKKIKNSPNFKFGYIFYCINIFLKNIHAIIYILRRRLNAPGIVLTGIISGDYILMLPVSIK